MNCSMFTMCDLDRFSTSLKAIDRGLQRLKGVGGALGLVGSLVARLATVLSVDGIVTLELTPTRTALIDRKPSASPQAST